MPPWSLHQLAKATEPSNISLLRPGRIWLPLSLATPM